MVSRQNLTDRLNLIRNATASTPITKEFFATFLNDWIDFMTKDGVYDMGALDAWKAQSLNQSSQVSHTPSGQLTAINVKVALEQLDALTKVTKDGLVTISTLPQSILDFAGAKMLPSYATFTRPSIGSYVDVNGIIKYAKAGQPRFTHNPVTKESLGILIEEARTNILTSSNSSLSGNVNSVITVNSTATKSPDGQLNATLVENINGQCTTFVSSNVPTAVGFYTRSIFIKPNAANAILIFEGTGMGVTNVQFNAISKTWVNATTSCIDSGYELYPNGWIRVWIVVQQTAGNSLDKVYYIGAYGGAAVSNAMFVFGHQYELGKCPTSYIQTSGSVVTRAGDDLSIPAKCVPQVEGCFVIGGVIPSKVSTNMRILSLLSNPIIGYISADFTIVSYDTGSQFFGSNAVRNDTIALSYSQNVRKLVGNGGSVVSGSNVIGLYNNPLFIGSNGSGNAVINGTIKRLTIYSRMLTDTELVKATSATLSSNQAGGLPSNSDLNQLAYMDATTILSVPNRQELSMDGTAASVTRNIRRPYDFSFSIVDSSGVTITSQPAASCLANTDNALIFTAPVGKTITYAITPYFEY